MTKFTGNVLQPVLELDFFRSRHQHSEGDCLGVSVCESLVSSIGEQQLPPIRRERGERFTTHGELLCHFVAQEATKASSSVSQISCIPGRRRLPTQKALEEIQKAGRRFQFVARGLDVSD